MNIKNSQELVQFLEQKKIWIYGTGFVANSFWESIKPVLLNNNLNGFLVSKKTQDSFGGYPVKEVSEVVKCENEVICIAVHESIKNEIVKNLNLWGLDNYIWIYPFFWELKLGPIAEKNVKISVDKIIRASISDYKLAIRYMAIEQYYGKNSCGYEMYLKAFSVFGKRETAERRLQKLCDLIFDWERNGYDTESLIITNSNYELIDGHHRVALAKYYGMDDISGNVYSTNENVSLGNGAMTRQIFTENGFSEEEIRLLDKYQKEVLLKE